MSQEREGKGLPLSAIHINLKDRSVTFEAQDHPVAKLTFTSEGVIFFPQPQAEAQSAALPTQQPESAEQPKPVILSGKLKTQPKAGKPDRQGRPTAYARFSAHVEGEQGPHDYLATFHRHTAKIALGLTKDSSVTAQGYVHPSGEPKRLDTFSVINLLKYPGQPEKPQG